MSGELLTENKSWREGLTGYHYLVLAVAIMGWMFDTMDQCLFVFARQHALSELLGPTATAADITRCTGTVTMCLMFGWAVGGLVFGMIGDYLGRTRTMMITILMYAIFTGLSGLAQTWVQFAVFRFLVGLGVGGEFAAGAALVAESFPAHARAVALSIVQAMSALGNVTAGVINLAMASVISPAEGWRWLFFIGIIPAFLVIIIFFFVHEPESWVQARSKAKGAGLGMGNMLGLFTDKTLLRNTIVGVLLASVGVIGFWGIGVWSGELLRKILNPDGLAGLKAVTEQKVSYALMSQNFGSFLGALLYGYMARSLGRRPAFAISLLGCLIIIPSAFFFTNSFPTAMIFFFLMGFALLAVFGGYAVYFPELFPTRLRATGTGFCYNSARFISAFAPAIFGGLAASYGLRNAAYMISMVFIIGLFALIFAPETKGKPLME
ncbi:MAG TPA: MFS transporter [Candidatus Hydrogenedentes bacterium]|nr:MFS transporter [Candidatus Hydrogenedentota bacterium]